MSATSPETILLESISPPVPVPREIALCPECGGDLAVEIVEWEFWTGVPTPGGMLVFCGEDDAAQDEERGDDADFHEYRQSEWMSTRMAAQQWAIEHIRIQ